MRNIYDRYPALSELSDKYGIDISRYHDFAEDDDMREFIKNSSFLKKMHNIGKNITPSSVKDECK